MFTVKQQYVLILNDQLIWFIYSGQYYLKDLKMDMKVMQVLREQEGL